MKSRRLLALTVAAGVLFAVSPRSLNAQGTTTTSAGGASSTGGAQGASGLSSALSSSGLSSSGLSSSSSGTGATPATVDTKINIVATSSGNGTATGVPSNTNPFVSWYGDALSMGLPSKFLKGAPASPTATFGKGIYTTTTTTSSAASAASSTTKTPTSFMTQGPRAPAYSTVLADDVPYIVHQTSALQNSVQTVLDRSTNIKNRAGINFTVKGTTVELSGAVSTDRERRIIEGMVRMTPGVRDVQNALQVTLPK